MTEPVRLLEPGDVSWLRSQSLYHTVARAMTRDSPDTLILLRPRSPYFCLGYHQDAEELDLEWCRASRYPVVRRRLGGGTAYLDRHQLFYQCIFHHSRCPARVSEVYRHFLRAPVLALRGLGLPVEHRGENELQVDGRRIAGIGGGRIGEAMVVVGNVIFRFPYLRMVRAWRRLSPLARRLAEVGLRRYLTTLTRELHPVPTPAEVRERLRHHYASTLGRPLVPGELSPGEVSLLRRVEPELLSPALLHQESWSTQRGLKLTSRAYVWQAEPVLDRQRLQIALRTLDGRIDALAIRRQDGKRLRGVERVLRGQALEPESLVRRLDGRWGLPAEALAAAILEAVAVPG